MVIFINMLMISLFFTPIMFCTVHFSLAVTRCVLYMQRLVNCTCNKDVTMTSWCSWFEYHFYLLLIAVLKILEAGHTLCSLSFPFFTPLGTIYLYIFIFLGWGQGCIALTPAASGLESMMSRPASLKSTYPSTAGTWMHDVAGPSDGVGPIAITWTSPQQLLQYRGRSLDRTWAP